MPGRRTWNEAEIEAEVDRRVKKQKEVVADAVESLRPELQEMSNRIQDSNHVKTELKDEFGEKFSETNDKLEALTREVRQTNDKLERHVEQRTHTAAAPLLAEFGVDKLSLEQKQALAGVLGAAVQDGQGSARRAVWIGFATQIISAIAGAAMAVAGFLALIASGSIQIGVSHHP